MKKLISLFLAVILILPACTTETGGVSVSVIESNGNGFALYGGVKLPNIDSAWTDKETYPYACIAHYDDSSAAMLMITKSPLIYDGLKVTGESDGQTFIYDPELTTEASEDWAYYADVTSEQGVSEVIWASQDILNEDSTLYLAASSPIPLDGMTVIEWDGDTDGLTGSGYLWMVADVVEAELLKNSVSVGVDDQGAVVSVVQYPYVIDDGKIAQPSVDGETASLIYSAYNSDEFSSGLYFSNASTLDGGRTALFAYPLTTSGDLKPVYLRVNGEWVKQTAYERRNGGWVLISTAELASYEFSGDTLTIYEYDGSLSHSWDWDTMQYDVEANS